MSFEVKIYMDNGTCFYLRVKDEAEALEAQTVFRQWGLMERPPRFARVLYEGGTREITISAERVLCVQTIRKGEL